jgi:hypothetical protein
MLHNTAKNVQIWEIYTKFIKYLHFYIIVPNRLGQFLLENLVFTCTKKIVPGHDMFLGKSINILEIKLFFSENSVQTFKMPEMSV